MPHPSRRFLRIGVTGLLALSLMGCLVQQTRQDDGDHTPPPPPREHVQPELSVHDLRSAPKPLAGQGALKQQANAPAGRISSNIAEEPRPDPGHRPLQGPAVRVNPFVETQQDAQSTFSIDVDTASYTLARRDLLGSTLPPRDSVRVEEFVNFFDHGYDSPRREPFAIHLEGAPSPLDARKTLVRVGIQGREVAEAQRQPANLVFLVDVSGSMQAANKLGLVKYALKNLVDKLQPSDTLGIVVYAGSEGVLLEPTAVRDKATILEAIDELEAGGSTNGEAGIRRAYALAEKARVKGANNRVVLCTDGDFNVGATGQDLVDLVVAYREKGVTLTTLGFGQGNYKDEIMEQLADKGNGNYAYIDTPNEALRVLGSRLVSTLQVIAKDVKIQIDFDKAAVRRYRLLGYENRDIADEDFTNDKVDAGEIGAGHSVTAYYELELAPGYQGDALGEVKVRYKQPEGSTSTQVAQRLRRSQLRDTFASASRSFRFGARVAQLAEILRESPHVATTAGDIRQLRSDFKQLIAEGKALSRREHPEEQEFVKLAIIAADLLQTKKQQEMVGRQPSRPGGDDRHMH